MFHNLAYDSSRLCYQVGISFAEKLGDELQGSLKDFIIDLPDEEEYFIS